MPAKNPPKRISGQTDDQYLSAYKSYLKENSPGFGDDILDDLAREEVGMTKPNSSQISELIGKGVPAKSSIPKQQVDNSLSELARKFSSAKTTGQAFRQIIPDMAKPEMIDPVQATGEIKSNEALNNLVATARDGEPVTAPSQQGLPVSPTENPSLRNIQYDQTAATLAQSVQMRKEMQDRNKDIFSRTADRAIPEGTEEQKQIYAQTLRDNEEKQLEYEATIGANTLPDSEFKKHVKVDDILKENRGQIVSAKYGGDVDNINQHIREYMDSPQWKIDAMKYARGPQDLDKSARYALDIYADRMAGAPTRFQERVSEFMNTPLGQAVSPIAETVEGAAKAPVEIGGFLGALVSTAGKGLSNALNNKSTDLLATFAEKNKKNAEITNKAVPSFRSQNAPEWLQFVGEIGNTVGAIEGGVLSTKGIPSIFEKGRKGAAYGSTSELSKLASEAGKTPQSAYLGELSNVLKTSSAQKSAEILDNTIKNIAMMGGQTYNQNVEKYKSYGFSQEEAEGKAVKSTMINMVGLAIPGVIRPHKSSELNNVLGRSGKTNAAGQARAAVRQGLNFAGDMAALKAIEGQMDGKSIEETFKGGLKNAAKDLIVGAVLNIASGGNGKRNVSNTQRTAIAEALKDRSILNSEIQKSGNEEQLKNVNGFLNTIDSYFKEALRKGVEEPMAVAQAIEKATMIQNQVKLNQLIAEKENRTEEFPSIDQNTGKEVIKRIYQHEDGQWRETPDPKLEGDIQAAINSSENARNALINLEKGTYDGNRVIGAEEMDKIASSKSPDGTLRPEQKVPVEINSPYNVEKLDLTQYVNNPEIKQIIESFGDTELTKDAYLDVNPIIAEDGSVIDGMKGIAAALHRGQTSMYAYKSMPKEQVDAIVNESAEEGLSTEVDEKGLDKVDKAALKEMTEVYADVLTNNLTEQGLPDFSKAIQAIIQDGLNRGYDKTQVLDMANRINANIPEPILERFYNDAIKSPIENTTPEQEAISEKFSDELTGEPEQISEPIELNIEPEINSTATNNEKSAIAPEEEGVVVSEEKETPESLAESTAARTIKKTILTKRVYEGDFREGVKAEIEKLGLDRFVESRKEASQKARKLIEEIGADAAVDAVKKKDIEGATSTYVLDAVASDLSKQMREESDPEKRTALEKRQAEILNDLEEISKTAGRQIGALADVYASSDLAYNLAKRIEDYKKTNQGEISEEKLEKLRELDKQLYEVNEKIKEAESRYEEEKSKLKEKEPKTYSERSKRVADQFRKLKSKPLILTNADGTEIIVEKNAIPGIDELIELGAKAIEKTGEIADGVKAIKDRLAAERWFSKLSDEDKNTVMTQIEDHFNIEDQIHNEKLLNLNKKRTLASIADFAQKIKDQNFEKKTRKLVVEDNELIKLRAEKMRIKDEFDKLQAENEIKNRSGKEKLLDGLKGAWGITRSLRATGELSYVGIQGLAYTVSHPKIALEAAKRSVKFILKESNAEDWLNTVKSQEWYPVAKKAGLAITEPTGKDSAREEAFIGNWTNFLWDKIIGAPTLAMSKSAQEAWRKKNPLRALERGMVGYLDTIRVERFLDGMELLEAKGKNPRDNPKDYKDVADLINTLTGRASLGTKDSWHGINGEAVATGLGNIFFSPRMWASQIKTSSPYALHYFSKLSPTARKMAVRDYGAFVGATAGLVAMIAAQLNNDGDPETGVEFDPRSTDFGKIKLGNIRVDPWGGHIQDIILSAREITGQIKDKEGNIKKAGDGLFTPDRFDLLVNRSINKLAPTPSILYRAMTKREKKGKTVDKFGNPYSLKEDLTGNLYPIYFDTIADLIKDKDSAPALDGFLTMYALFGGGVNVYNK